jgi:hypothetical protein
VTPARILAAEQRVLPLLHLFLEIGLDRQNVDGVGLARPDIPVKELNARRILPETVGRGREQNGDAKTE